MHATVALFVHNRPGSDGPHTRGAGCKRMWLATITGVTQVCGERGRVNSIASFWAIHFRSARGLPFHDWWIGMIAEVFGTVAILNVPPVEYRRHGGNASTSSGRSRAPIADRVLRRTLMVWYLLLLWLGRTLFSMVLASPQGRPD